MVNDPESLILSLKERERYLLLEIKKKEKLITSQKAYIEELEIEIIKSIIKNMP